MSNARQRLEAAVKSLQEFSDQLDAADAPLSGEDMSNLKSRMEEIKDLKGQVEAEAEAAGAVKEAHEFMKGLAGGDAPKDRKSALVNVDGLPMDTQGKTFGEMFVDSGAYKEFIGRYAGRDGIIPSTVKGLQSGPFSADVKALVTGASSTSGGAFVVNDRYAPTIDLVGERELTVYDLVT
ncbi:MAG TPA: hypothetical protein P5074_15400, partial [Candidatus Nanopelagicales bacterium]|nr:hypothetical protein [Candidatus Nanopelagicales bacterium]